MQIEKNSSTVNHLIALYNKAVEYYSAMNDDRHLKYLTLVKQLFKDEHLLQQLDQAEADKQDFSLNQSQNQEAAPIASFEASSGVTEVKTSQQSEEIKD